MTNKFNLYSRTEEEKTRDIIMYEKKAHAREICELFEKKKKRADIVTVCSAVVFAAAAFPLFYKAYDSESIIGMLSVILSAVLLTVLARLVAGAVLTRSLKVFLKWGSLCTRWKEARKEMHDYEAKFTDQTVFEADMKKAEKRLMDACDALNSFAEKHGITVD
ncbi:MAG: hypothetical protein E7647_01005 [Ruminococcaceae bacterium]|nr:hypothetical protein [Oscillospiraceae bacterium]